MKSDAVANFNTYRAHVVKITVALGCAFLLFLISCQPSSTPKPPSGSTQDVLQNPRYQNYEFGRGDYAIDVGFQPLWIPTNTIVEVMRRDITLREALSGMGMTILFHPFSKGADVNVFLRSGDLEAGIGGDMPALSIASNYPVFIPTLFQLGFATMVAKEFSPISSLKGKRIGYPFGSNAHFMVLSALDSGGMEEKDVVMVPLDVDKMPLALERGEIDAFAAWEPTPTIAVTKYPSQKSTYRKLTTGYMYFPRDFTIEYPDVVRHLIASQIRAMAWLKLGEINLTRACRWTQESWQKFTGKKLILTIEQIRKLNMDDLLGVASVPLIPESVLSKDGQLYSEYVFLKKIGKINPDSDWSSVVDSFDSTMVREVMRDAENYSLLKYKYEDAPLF